MTQLTDYSKNCSPAPPIFPPTMPHPALCITPPRSPVQPFSFRLPPAWDLGRSDSAGGAILWAEQIVSPPWRPCVLCSPEPAARCCPQSAAQNSGASPRVSADTGGVCHPTLGGFSTNNLWVVLNPGLHAPSLDPGLSLLTLDLLSDSHFHKHALPTLDSEVPGPWIRV